MKRIISQATLVALIATTVAPVVQARWINNGLESFRQAAKRDMWGLTIPCCACILAGITAIIYESTHRDALKRARENYQKDLAEYNKQQVRPKPENPDELISCAKICGVVGVVAAGWTLRDHLVDAYRTSK